MPALLASLAALTPATLAGFAAVATGCTWPLLESRQRILAIQVLGSCLFALHYTLLGAHTAAAMCVAGALQGVAAARLAGWRRNSVVAATIAASLAVTASTWEGLASLLAQTGQLLSAAGRLQPGTQAIRVFFLVSEAFWVSHNALVGSRWGLTSDAMAVSMLLIGLWRGYTARHGSLPAATAAARA